MQQDVWREAFDKRAVERDEALAVDTNRKNLWEYRERLFTSLRRRSIHGPMLDIGCGPGTLSRMLQTRGYREQFGVDISAAMVERAKRESVGTGAEFAVADASMLPYPDDFFTVVVFFGVLQCIPDEVDQELALKEIHRVLAPGGRLYLVTLNRFSLGRIVSHLFNLFGLRKHEDRRGTLVRFSRRGLRRLLARHSFKVASMQGVYAAFFPFSLVMFFYRTGLFRLFNWLWPLFAPLAHLHFVEAEKR